MLRIRQIVFVVRDLAASSARLSALLEVGAPYRDPGVAEFGIDNAVFAFGDQFVELISPVRAGTAAGRHLDRRGEGGYMLILQTDDFDRERARVRALGVRTVWEKELPDIRAMHLHPKDIGGAIVSIDQPVPAGSWRWGGPAWKVAGGARGRQRVVGVTLESPDPSAMAMRWSQVLGLDRARAEESEAALPLHQGRLDFVPSRSGAEGICGFELAVADRAAVLDAARARHLGGVGDAIDAFGAHIVLQAA